jgi:hypothetical protein
MDDRARRQIAVKEGAIRSKVVSRLLGEMKLKRLEGARAEWRRELKGVLIHLQGTGDGTWWLTAAGETENPGLEFSGNLGQCVMQYAALVISIQAGVWRSK